MEFQEFKFIYDDYKNQIKSFPKLTNLLSSTEKSIKKLQCLSLYSLVERRELDVQIQEEKIYNDIRQLFRILYGLHNKNELSYEELFAASQKLRKVKQTNMETYDLLTTQEQLLGEEVQLAQYYLGDQDHQNEIKEVDEDEQIRDQNGNTVMASTKQQDHKTQPQLNKQRYDQLKEEIQAIQNKIVKINNGRGKWLKTDHDDFVKIYNRCQGNAKKIVQQGVKFLGMTNTQIMDHLETYDQYIQLEKEKKIVSFEYKQLKLMEQANQMDILMIKKEEQQMKEREKERFKAQQIASKKELIRQFRLKRSVQKKDMLEQAEKERTKQMKPAASLTLQKKKQIVERNKKFIETREEQFKKVKPGSLHKRPPINQSSIKEK